MGDRWRIGENAQPAKGVDFFKEGKLSGRHTLAGDAVIAITTGDKITVQFLVFTILLINNARPIRPIIFDRDRRRRKV